MDKVAVFPIGIRLWGCAAPEEEEAIYQHTIDYQLDILESLSSADQLRSLERFRSCAIKALGDLLGRFPAPGESPTIYVSAWTVSPDEPFQSLGFSLRYYPDRRGHCVSWYPKGSKKVQEVFFNDPAAAVRQAGSILEEFTNEWLLTCPRVSRQQFEESSADHHGAAPSSSHRDLQTRSSSRN